STPTEPATSPTLWVPVLTVTSPVVPPLAASVLSVVPSTWRSKRPGSLVGESDLTTSILPVSRTLVIVQTMSSPKATLTSSGPACSAPLFVATTEPEPFLSSHPTRRSSYLSTPTEPATSPTLWVPVLTVTSPVVPPLAASVLSVVPSTWR